VVGEGRLEVLVRQSDGIDKWIDSKQRGDVIGEVSLLTGALRTATVRAMDGAIVYEIGKQQYEPIIRARPGLADELAMLMEKHLRNIHEQRAAYNGEKEILAISRRIRRFFFGD
jgi:CRP-like cAMP-binding protein